MELPGRSARRRCHVVAVATVATAGAFCCPGCVEPRLLAPPAVSLGAPVRLQGRQHSRSSRDGRPSSGLARLSGSALVAFSAPWLARHWRFLSHRRASPKVASEVDEAQAMLPEWKSAEEYLTSTAGLSARQMKQVRKFWEVSGGRAAPVEKCREVLEFLTGREVGLSKDEAAAVIAASPRMLILPVRILGDQVRFLCEEANVAERELPTVLARFPQMFTQSITETLRPALEFWIGTVGVPREELSDLLHRAPAEVWLKPETLAPKWRFAKDIMGLTLDDLLACKTPYFRLSLARTVAPRHFFLLHQRQKKAGDDSQPVSLDGILGSSDENFCAEVARCPKEEYMNWLAAWPGSEQFRALAWIQPRGAERRR
mmetsp:Transcript_33134/g.72204  ORF Transcript_33134/g.72204 Transcript_33134/m.72204 type:complete len:372 (-) Transcript_33134:121-1236(-)